MTNDIVTVWGDGLKIARQPVNGELLIGNGTNFNLSALTAGSGVTIANSSGVITISATGSGGTVTSVTGTAPITSSGGATPNIALSTPLVVQYGGTGLSTITSGSLMTGNGTGAVNLIAPGASGNVLTSNGSAWVSTLPTWNRIYKNTSQSITSSTSFTDITSLTFSVTAGVTYYFRSFVIVDTGAGGIRLSVNGPAATTIYYGQSNSFAAKVYNTIVSSGSGAVILIQNINGIIVPSANGTVALRVSQDTSNAAASTIVAGSWIEWNQA